MTTSRRRFLAFPFVAALVAACGGKSQDSTVVVKSDADWTPQIITTEQVVGSNRFVLGVLDKTDRPIVDGKMHLTFFDLTTGSAVKTAEMDAASRVPARDAGLNEQIVHIHPDGS